MFSLSLITIILSMSMSEVSATVLAERQTNRHTRQTRETQSTDRHKPRHTRTQTQHPRKYHHQYTNTNLCTKCCAQIVRCTETQEHAMSPERVVRNTVCVPFRVDLGLDQATVISISSARLGQRLTFRQTLICKGTVLVYGRFSVCVSQSA